MNRRTFLKTTATSALFLGPAARSAETARPKATDDEILAQCQARIEKHRKGDGVIVLRDALGKPVSRAAIQIEQTQHDFLFGCNFFMFDRNGDPEREEAYRARFTALLNYATLGFYWAAYERERGKPNYDYTDRVADYCAQHGILCKGHPLVWDHPAGSPSWLPDDLSEIKRLSNARVREIVGRFKGRIDFWDVVNEATHLPDTPNKTKMGRWGRTLGPVEYVAQHLRIAREANPAATLLVNDYRIEPAYYRILDRLRTNGKLEPSREGREVSEGNLPSPPSRDSAGPGFDAVGIQSHMHGGVWPLGKVWHVCDTYAPLGLPLHFTETTIVSGPRLGPGENWGTTTPEGEEKQAGQTVKFYTALFAHPAVQAITWWDFSDHGAWQRAPAGWLRRDMSPKPVYEHLSKLIKGEWWTKMEVRPNALGHAPLRALYGKHRVTIKLPSGARLEREIHLRRGKPNRFELTLA